MSNPFQTLGLNAWATPEDIRGAYRSLARQCHPDMIRDPEEKAAAQNRMVQLNLAYEEALRLANPRPQSAPDIPREEALRLAEKMLSQGSPESALRQLLRADSRDADWFYLQGQILMAMEQYDSAHQSFREAVRSDPENNRYRQGALDAVLALRKSNTIPGKMKKLFKRKKQN